jgi:hypothetical protein
MSWSGGVYTLPAGTATPVVSQSALGMAWSNATWTDIQNALNAILGGGASVLFTRIDLTGPFVLNGSAGTAGQVATSQGAGNPITWTTPAGASYTGTLKTLTTNLSIPANAEYTVKGPVFTVPAGDVCTVAAGGLLRVADWSTDQYYGVSDETMHASREITPGTCMNVRAPFPFTLAAGTTLTVPAGAALMA